MTVSRYVGTELMVRKLLADRLYLTPEEAKPKDGTPSKITWLKDMTVTLRLVVDKSVQAKQPKGLKVFDAHGHSRTLNKNGNVKATKSGGHAFRVEVELGNIRHKNDEGDRLNATILLVNNNGAFTKWHLKEAAAWFKRAMPKVEYSAALVISDGLDISTRWQDGRKKKIEHDFFYVSASQLIADSQERDAKAESIKKYNLDRSSMYALWAKNLKGAAFFYDQVRTGGVA